MQDTLFHNRYRLLRKLGRGSFGEVWRAHDEVADIDIAVKIYIALDERGIEDFRQEFKNVHRLNHPNLLRPEHYDVADSRPFLVMQLCNGSVERQIGDMSEEDMWHFIHDVASGLSYLHSHEIIHRDIKPDNILLSTSGEFMISDFGISTRMQSSMRRSSVRQKQDMDIAGTITYMAPELFSKNPLTVKATDIWALGATMYEVLTGDILFLGQGGILQLKGAEIPDLPDAYSHDLRTLITDCLSLNTWDRPTAEELYTYVDAKIKNRPIAMPWRERSETFSSTTTNHSASDSSRKTQRHGTSIQSELTLSVDPKELNMPAKGGNAVIDVITNGTWYIPHPKKQKWIQTHKLSNSSFAIQITPNRTGKMREYMLRVPAHDDANNSLHIDIPIKQPSMPKTTKHWLWSLLIVPVLAIIIGISVVRASDREQLRADHSFAVYNFDKSLQAANIDNIEAFENAYEQLSYIHDNENQNLFDGEDVYYFKKGELVNKLHAVFKELDRKYQAAPSGTNLEQKLKTKRDKVYSMKQKLQ